METQAKININERSEGEYKVPEFYNANWRDDVASEAEEQDKIKSRFQFFDNESSYDSSKNQIKDKDKINRFQMAARIRHMALKSLR